MGPCYTVSHVVLYPGDYTKDFVWLDLQIQKERLLYSYESCLMNVPGRLNNEKQ